MEKAVRENDYVIVICTPAYKRKADMREGGVGYEGDIMTGEAFALKNRRKFIPVLRSGEWPEASPSWLLGNYYVDLRESPDDDSYSLLLDTLHRRLPEPPPVKAQGFKYLADRSVLDAVNSLVWWNCRSTEMVKLEELDQKIQTQCQCTGYLWRLPEPNEIAKVQEAEEYYPRPPVMVKISLHHPFFGTYEKAPWTEERRRNVKKSDHTGSIFNANAFAAGWSGLASMINVDPYHMAVEAETLRRQFLFRLVREAADEDFEAATIGE